MVKRDKEKIEKMVRNCLIIATFISLLIVILNFTYLIYNNSIGYHLDTINDFLVKYVNNFVLWIDNIFIYVLSIIYIWLAIKSKKEVILKISFSIFSVLTTMVVMTLIINQIAEIFSIFG